MENFITISLALLIMLVHSAAIFHIWIMVRRLIVPPGSHDCTGTNTHKTPAEIVKEQQTVWANWVDNLTRKPSKAKEKDPEVQKQTASVTHTI